MKKTELITEIQAMLEKMKPELNRLGVMHQFQVHEKSEGLLYTDVIEAHKWLKERLKTTWEEAHFFYKRHPESRWDDYCASDDPFVAKMNEVKQWFAKSLLLRKSLKKRPTFFKIYEVQKLLKPKQKRGRKPNVK